MSVFIDRSVRKALTDHLLTIGTEAGFTEERVLDLSVFGDPAYTEADILFSEGEDAGELPQDRDWLEYFLVKSPQRIFTPSGCGISRKAFQFVIWVKTQRWKDTHYNEMVAGLIEDHFNNNQHFTLDNGDILTVLKTYQQASIVKDSASGRLFNRVFVDCENYFKNNNK